MTSKRKLAGLGIAFVVVGLMVVTNPSEDRHLDAFAGRVQAWQSGHAQTCHLCDSVTDADQLRLMAISRIDRGGILIGDGLQRENYVLFSVLTREGIADARTFGFLGCVFGPTFSSPFPCPQRNSVVVPEPRHVSEFDSQFSFSVLADGSLAHNGESVTQTELESRLVTIRDKETTAIVIEVAAKCRHAEVTRVVDWVSSLGFGLVQMSVAAEADQ